jgi:hypothetical protein
MIKLSCDCYVNPHEVSEVTVNQSSQTATVRMKSGVGHSVGADYGKGIYSTVDRLISEISAATATGAQP